MADIDPGQAWAAIGETLSAWAGIYVVLCVAAFVRDWIRRRDDDAEVEDSEDTSRKATSSRRRRDSHISLKQRSLTSRTSSAATSQRNFPLKQISVVPSASTYSLDMDTTPSSVSKSSSSLSNNSVESSNKPNALSAWRLLPRDGAFFVYLHFIDWFLSFMVCGFWILRTAFPTSYSNIMLYLETAFFCFFAFHFFIRFWASAGEKLDFLMNFQNAIDLLSTIAFFMGINSSPAWLCLTFFRSVVISRSLNESAPSVQSAFKFSQLEMKILKVIVSVATLIYVFTCCIFIAENIPEFPEWALADGEDMGFTLFNSVYFMFVTLSTVGYGDLSPSTTIGKCMLIFFIVVGICKWTRHRHRQPHRYRQSPSPSPLPSPSLSPSPSPSQFSSPCVCLSVVRKLDG